MTKRVGAPGVRAIGASQPLTEPLSDLGLGLVGVLTPEVLQHEVTSRLEEVEGEAKPAGDGRVHGGKIAHGRAPCPGSICRSWTDKLVIRVGPDVLALPRACNSRGR